MKDKANGFLDSMKTKLKENITLDTIPMDVNNRMLRIGVGLNDDHRSFRLDLWSVGYRINSKSKRTPKKSTETAKKEPSFKIYGNFRVDKIFVDSENTVIRIGYGKHKGTKFFRVDLWSTAYRITKVTA